MGGSRNVGDASRVENLRLLARELDIQEQVRFVVNAPFPDMLGWLARASIGLGTMVDEHFGINIVEFMVRPFPFRFHPSPFRIQTCGARWEVDHALVCRQAAGAIVVAHASGGPLLDIVVPLDGEPTGYHATSPETFAEAFRTVLTLSPEADVAMRTRARKWAVQKCSAEEFEKGWDGSGWRKWL